MASQLAEQPNLKASKEVLKLLDFLNTNCRDVLDESDEILSPKFQLIYTLGSPTDMEGGTLRWIVHGAVFRSISKHATEL